MSSIAQLTGRARSWFALLGACVACNSLFDIRDPKHKLNADAGAPSCILNSDCLTGEICLFRLCSPPCATDVDCSSGSRCLRTDSGTACVSQTQAGCDTGASAQCPSGTSCADGACYAKCSGNAGCRDGHECVAGVCNGAPSVIGDGAAGATNEGGAGGRVAMAGGSGSGGEAAGGTTGIAGGGGAAGGPVCGNGTLESGEHCDDGNKDASDGCSSLCGIEAGWRCDQSEPTHCTPICGDGLVLGVEAIAGGCDDQNTISEDGCSAGCKVEASYSCSGAPSACAKTCGNGTVDSDEGCDDGNTAPGDGCVACAIELGYTCSNTQTKSTCTDTNECTKGTANCSANANCSNTPGSYTCACKNGYSGNGLSCASTCGDGIRVSTEACDDGNAVMGDGCSPSCTVETGFSCDNTQAKSACTCTGSNSCGVGIAAAWDGALVEFGCGITGSGYDCAEPAAALCVGYTTSNPVLSVIPPSNGAPTSWKIGGTSGTTYNVTVRIRGIVEVTSYVGGTRDQGTTSITVSQDLFQQGGTPQISGGPSFDYDPYEIDVTPPVAGAANTYFLNSVTTAENPHASPNPTNHLTFPIDYTKTIKVAAGGTISLKVTDSNCTKVQNCGPSAGGSCLAPRSVDLSGAIPAAPSTFVQPFANGTFHGQWLFFDVTSVIAQ
ncbi:MAG: DUF4215 domain-containing protein [Polyangiaceae bacterium]